MKMTNSRNTGAEITSTIIPNANGYQNSEDEHNSYNRLTLQHGGEGNLRPRRPPREYLGEYTS